MPRRDGTGPFGTGCMTGRRAGYGRGAGISWDENPSMESGMGRARGCRGGRTAGNGFRWRNWFRATVLPGWMKFGGYGTGSSSSGRTNEENDLRNRANLLEAELESLRQRLEEIGAASSTK